MFLNSIIGTAQQAELRVSVVGGSNSVMRRGYTKYLASQLRQATCLTTSLQYYALGGVPNIFGLIQEARSSIALNSDLILFEYCVNDRHAIETNHYSLELAGKSLEGFIRKCHKSNPYCLIVLVIFGVNKDSYYSQDCALSQLYESIGNRYRLPVVNLTKLLNQQRGENFVKSLYSETDEAHYTIPDGVKVVSQTIVEQLDKIGVINNLKSDKNFPLPTQVKPVYSDNLANLSFFSDFELGNFFTRPPRRSIYQNSVYREKNFTLYQGNALKFWLKGSLAAIYLKSDLRDGFIRIQFGAESLVTSSYSAWVNRIKPQNVINLITLPLQRFSPSSDFALVSISGCQEYPEQFELDYVKQEPKYKQPHKWKLSVIGIAYLGELKPPE